ncbi:MAG: hypothetical protein H0V89_01355 [Deltaproteobacteria bacterium]|nr:hypothetical protein [Deltaproteobacteria bacterium]
MTVDVQAGLGIGDVERYADLRATLDVDGNQLESWYQEGPFFARRPRGGIFVGYAPATMIDFGLFFGLQYSNRVLTTGVTRQRSDGSTEIIGNPRQDLQAVQMILQPRVRGYLVPLGPVKPYVFTAPEFRIFDKYKLDQGTTAPVYPIPPGGTMFGWCGGAGLLIDPGPIIGLFAEGSYTQFFGARSNRTESGAWSSPHPVAPVPRHNTLAVSGGVQFRI